MSRRATGRNARRAVLAGLLAVAALNGLLVLAVETTRPEWRDPEFGVKLKLLRARAAEEPDRPLVVLLGSSRAALGFRPDALGEGGETGPVVFNGALAGAGPLLELLVLRRLLDRGIRPAAVLVEVMPPLLNQPEGIPEANRLPLERVCLGDLGVLRRYWPDPDPRLREWFGGRLAAWHTHRFALVSLVHPDLLGWDARQDRWNGLDRHGWLPDPRPRVSREEYERGAEFARREYEPCLRAYRIAPDADRALRELLTTCHREGVSAHLLCMPEGADFARWYPPGALDTFRAYMDGLCREYGLRWTDARTWIGREAFTDSHHLLAAGAEQFSRRFGREVFATGWVDHRVSGGRGR
jgi:hypothetical protein